MKKIFIPFWIISISLLFTSCSAAVRTPGAMNSQTGQAAPNQDYQIQIGDTLDIKFFYHPELNESVIVRPDGRISLQLVHEVQASGLTPETLRENLRGKYEPQISKPEITVIVRSFTAQKVYVDGEVAKPGLIPLTGPDDGSPVHRLGRGIERHGPDQRDHPHPPGPGKPAGLDAGECGKGDRRQRPGPGPLRCMPADIVYVPKSPIANVNLWVDQYIRKNIPIPFGFYV